MKLNKKGFTLVELLVTIVIVGLVIGLSVFGIIKLINNSEEKTTILNQSNLKEAARIYSAEMGSDSWKKNDNYDAFCVTVGELMNKGLLDKNAEINGDIDRNNFIIVKRNKVTLAIENEEIVTDNTNEENNNICTGQINNNEDITAPEIEGHDSYTDRIVINFSEGKAYSGIKNYTCLYGTSSSNINREGTIEGNKCILDSLKSKTPYYVFIYMNTNNGSSVLANGDIEYSTIDFMEPVISQNKNVVTITYDDNNVIDAEHYFKSDIDGESNINVEKCTLSNNKFTCSGSTKNIEKDSWYKVSDKEVNITYSEEDNDIEITARIQDKSNNYKEEVKDIKIRKYTVKFYKNTASQIDGKTSDYVERHCISDGSSTCNITSPSITAPTGYSAVGWNTSSSATTSSWNVETEVEINTNLEYYAIISINSYTYNIVYKSSSGIELGTDTITKNYGTTNEISPKLFTGYTSPSSQQVKWDSTSVKTITFTYTPISYTISYTLNSGSVSGNPSSYTIESSDITLKNPTRSGYTFTGWTGSNGITKQTSVIISKGSTGNKSYTANWEETLKTMYVNSEVTSVLRCRSTPVDGSVVNSYSCGTAITGYDSDTDGWFYYPDAGCYLSKDFLSDTKETCSSSSGGTSGGSSTIYCVSNSQSTCNSHSYNYYITSTGTQYVYVYDNCTRIGYGTNYELYRC